MAYITVAEARRASRSRYATRSVAEAAIRKLAATPARTSYDIFLSHSYQDAELIAGVAGVLESEGLSVYVDWRDDPQLDRSRVTAQTASILRDRMRICRFLLYATSANSSSSRWMPWELGFFDGLRRGKVGILPVVEQANASFVGQEYLGLYPSYERITFNIGPRLGKWIGPNEGQTLSYAATT